MTPVYEYRCDKCSALLELTYGFYDPAPDCPVCDITMKKVIKPIRSIFRGSGWGRD